MKKARVAAGLGGNGDGSDRLGQLDAVELDGVRVVALVLVLAVALVEDVVDLVDQEVDGLVHLLGLGRAVDVGPAHFDVGLGDELVRDVMLAVALQFNADPDDVRLVSEKSLGFLLHVVLEGGGELEVDTGHNHIVGFIGMVHGFSFGWTNAKGAEGEEAPRTVWGCSYSAGRREDRARRHWEQTLHLTG